MNHTEKLIPCWVHCVSHYKVYAFICTENVQCSSTSIMCLFCKKFCPGVQNLFLCNAFRWAEAYTIIVNMKSKTSLHLLHYKVHEKLTIASLSVLNCFELIKNVNGNHLLPHCKIMLHSKNFINRKDSTLSAQFISHRSPI